MTHGPRLLVVLAMACLATFGLALPALGHASLAGSDPVAGGTLTTTPHTLTATFDEELTSDGSSLVIEGPSGAQVATGTVSADDAHVMTAELPALAPGQYTVRWTAVTADDLAVERGTYSFSVGTVASATPAPTAPPAGGAVSSGNDLVVALVLAAVAIVGVLAFVFVRGRR